MMSRFASLAMATAFTAIGTVTWMGCGTSDDRYYCDSTGCYQCDAYGCSTVTAPTHPTCTGSSSCAAGETCTSTGCTTTCTDDSTCPQGEVCKSNLCTAPTSDPGTTKDCTTKADCTGGTCVAGKCEACGGTAGPCPCTASTDCATGETCQAGSCTAAANICKFTSECADGKICADGECLTSCDASTCGAGFTCTKGVCEPTAPTTPACAADSDCSGGTPQCVAGACVPACATDNDCGSGKFCNQGACAVDTRPDPNCSTDADCGSGATPKKCVDGFCKYTCTAAQGDAYCATIDTRIPTCAKDLVCRSTAEADAQCTQASDCAAGQDCIDNACK